jgi:hypothetical protein
MSSASIAQPIGRGYGPISPGCAAPATRHGGYFSPPAQDDNEQDVRGLAEVAPGGPDISEVVEHRCAPALGEGMVPLVLQRFQLFGSRNKVDSHESSLPDVHDISLWSKASLDASSLWCGISSNQHLPDHFEIFQWLLQTQSDLYINQRAEVTSLARPRCAREQSSAQRLTIFVRKRCCWPVDQSRFSCRPETPAMPIMSNSSHSLPK